jgi:hypothetical protein
MVSVGVMPAGFDYTQTYTLAFTNSGVSLPVKRALTGQ